MSLCDDTTVEKKRQTREASSVSLTVAPSTAAASCAAEEGRTGESDDEYASTVFWGSVFLIACLASLSYIWAGNSWKIAH